MDIEKISKYVLTGLMAISIIIFILFFTIGYDTPYEENPKMNNPQLLDALCIWTYILIAAAAIFMLCSFIMFISQHGLNKSVMYTWGLPILSIAIGAGIGVSNQSETLIINGKEWNDSTGIILTDASMVSIAILAVIAVGVTAWSMVSEISKK